MVAPKWVPDAETMREMLTDMHEREAGTVLRPTELSVLLYFTAIGAETIKCDEEMCPHCNTFHRLFWELSNGLPRERRIEYQTALREQGVALPPAPWEEHPLK